MTDSKVLITASPGEIREQITALTSAASTLFVIQRRGQPTERELLDLLISAVEHERWMRKQVASMMEAIKAESQPENAD